MSCVYYGCCDHISVLVSRAYFVWSRRGESNKLAFDCDYDFVGSCEVEVEAGCKATKTIEIVVTVWEIHTSLVKVWLSYVNKTLLLSCILTQEICSSWSAHTDTLLHYFLFALKFLIKS